MKTSQPQLKTKMKYRRSKMGYRGVNQLERQKHASCINATVSGFEHLGAIQIYFKLLLYGVETTYMGYSLKIHTNDNTIVM